MHYHLPAHFPYTKPRTPLVRPACWTIANGHAKTKVTEGRHCTLSQGAKPLMFSAEIPVIKGAAGHSDGATQGRDWGHHLRDTPSAWRGPFKGQILVECDHLHPAGRLRSVGVLSLGPEPSSRTFEVARRWCCPREAEKASAYEVSPNTPQEESFCLPVIGLLFISTEL